MSASTLERSAATTGERTSSGSESPLRISNSGDRIQVRDEDLVGYLQGLKVALKEPDSGSRYHWLPLNSAHLLKTPMQGWDWADESGSRPTWLDEACGQASWARKTRRETERLAWRVGDVAVIQAPYALSLALRLQDLESFSRYSPLLKGWTLQGLGRPDVPESDLVALAQILATYDISASAAFSGVLEGRGGWRERLELAQKEALEAGFRVPSGFRSGRELHPHQKTAVLVMAHQGSTLLADQVGLGKGGEFICGLLCQAEHDQRHGRQQSFPAVVAVTKSMRQEIVEEILRWKHDAKVALVSGTQPAPIDEDVDFAVINHDILSARLPDLLAMKPRAFIADEAHVYKNASSKRTQAAQKLADATRKNSGRPYIVMASGTPFLNGPSELWSLLSILGLARSVGEHAMDRVGVDEVKIKTYNGWKWVPLDPARAYEMYFCEGKYRFGRWDASGARHTAELNRHLLDGGMVRRRKSDVIDPLPPLTENVAVAELSVQDREEYEELRDEFRDILIEQARQVAREQRVSEKTAVDIVKKKLSNSEGGMKMVALRQQVAMAKTASTVEWIHAFMDGSLVLPGPDGPTAVGDDPERRKLLVFAHHRDPRQMLLDHPELKQYGMVSVLPGGDMDDKTIQANKHAFQTDPDVRLMILSMAAREGHTLTAAKDVLLHELPYVPSWIIQMAGRCWARFSELFLPHEACITYMVAQGTVDIPALRRVRVKRAMIDAVIDGEGQDEAIEMRQEEKESDLNEMLAEMIFEGKYDLGLAA